MNIETQDHTSIQSHSNALKKTAELLEPDSLLIPHLSKIIQVDNL